MTTKAKVIVAVLALVAMFVAGYFTHSYRVGNRIAGYEKREQERMTQIAANDAEANKLRGENDALRQHVAELSTQDEALRAIIDSRGGAIAAEAKNLESINEELKTNQTVINNPTDRCVRCREFSARAVARGQIAKPLACKDECAVANQ